MDGTTPSALLGRPPRPTSTKAAIRAIVAEIPLVRPAAAALRRARAAIDQIVFRAGCYVHDYRKDRLHLGWRRTDGEYWKLSSELIFQYHKLEKGLCLPIDSRRPFGADPAREICRLLDEWRRSGGDREALVYRAAIEVLRAYRARLMTGAPPGLQAGTIARIDELLGEVVPTENLATPIPARPIQPCSITDLEALCLSRRSMRDYDGEPVDFALVERAVAIAQLSPSACNRQPWHLHFYDEPEAIRTMLALQNGNAGFGHKVPLLAVVTADLGSFFDSSERSEPALDGGLFLMSFILALQAQGLSSCCLNWCVPPATDRKGHETGQIPESEKILTFLAIGQAAEHAIVPLSARRPPTDVIRRHDALAPR